jgi:hypothetical protein
LIWLKLLKLKGFAVSAKLDVYMWSESKGVVKGRSKFKKVITILVVAILIAVAGFLVYKNFFSNTVEEQIANQLYFDASVTENEKQIVSDAIVAQFKTVDGDTNAIVETSKQASGSTVLDAYVPVTLVSAAKQSVTTEELPRLNVKIWHETDSVARTAIAETLGIPVTSLNPITSLQELTENEVAFIPAKLIDYNVKLLSLDNNYYLDSFDAGAVFRKAIFTSESPTTLNELDLNELNNKENTFKINQSGVTALTRVMMRKLDSVGDPLYFSEKIGAFMADADLTHISNEVSFSDNCNFSLTLFCSDPRFIETLKDSGVDLVEITGNHNNDLGSQNNTDTINLYRSLGWDVVGGGLNTADAAKYFIADKKQSKVAFLAYNYPDSPNGGAIAKAETAGANSFDFDRIQTDITNAKLQSQFVIVDVQFWECYAYPDGYVEYPICDLPIGEQEAVFKKLVDLGADMVVGTSAHQPQIYEMYNGKPIYYGLGNMYFDQTQWPGTERGVILTHYFNAGKLVQTKLSPTVYDENLQTQLMPNEEATAFLSRLQSAR